MAAPDDYKLLKGHYFYFMGFLKILLEKCVNFDINRVHLFSLHRILLYIIPLKVKSLERKYE